MVIQISAVICTLNRAEYLRKAIQSLVEQTLATEHYEIIVVDNHSIDNTKQVVTEEFAHVTNLRYLYEPVLGLSQARNTGWQNAKGKYIAYLDDDAIACSQWLEKILQAFETIDPQPGCVGGKVEPIWEADKPNWLSERFFPYLTIIDWSDTPTILEDRRYIAGANMAFPKFLLEKVAGFQVKLGRKGGKLLSNEEILLRDRIKDNGYSIYYDPGIAVKHHVSASRLTQSWFTNRFYWQGVSEAALLNYQKSPLFSERIELGVAEIKKILKSPKLLAHSVLPTKQTSHFTNKCQTFKRVGYVLGLFGLAR